MTSSGGPRRSVNFRRTMPNCMSAKAMKLDLDSPRSLRNVPPHSTVQAWAISVAMLKPPIRREKRNADKPTITAHSISPKPSYDGAFCLLLVQMMSKRDDYPSACEYRARGSLRLPMTLLEVTRRQQFLRCEIRRSARATGNDWSGSGGLVRDRPGWHRCGGQYPDPVWPRPDCISPPGFRCHVRYGHTTFIRIPAFTDIIPA